MKIIKKSRRPKGSAQIRKEKRATGDFWGYDVWIRQPDGSRKRYREFTFITKAEATQALALLRTNGWKSRYGVKPQEEIRQTTIKEAIESYLKVAKASLLANKTDETTYWRETPGHLRTLERWAKFAGPNRHVNTLTKDDFNAAAEGALIVRHFNQAEALPIAKIASDYPFKYQSFDTPAEEPPAPNALKSNMRDDLYVDEQ
jgi:hypothetical protein